jgi:putative transposase
MVQSAHKLSIERRCELLNVHRSTYYYKPKKKDETKLKEKIMGIYQKHPVYGYRRIRACLNREGEFLNHKKVQRLMKEIGLRAIYPGPVTTRPRKGDRIYPNLLKGFIVTAPYQAYQTDITYIRTLYGFMYLIAIIDSWSSYSQASIK